METRESLLKALEDAAYALAVPTVDKLIDTNTAVNVKTLRLLY